MTESLLKKRLKEVLQRKWKLYDQLGKVLKYNPKELLSSIKKKLVRRRF